MNERRLQIAAALRAYEQADMDGVMVKVSRQACDEAATILEAAPSATRLTVPAKTLGHIAWWANCKSKPWDTGHEELLMEWAKLLLPLVVEEKSAPSDGRADG